MKELTFDQLQGVTFADFSELTADDKVNARIAESFQTDPMLHADCPKCHARWEGTFEQLTQHVEECTGAPA